MKYLVKDTQLRTIIFEMLNSNDYFILEDDGDYYFFESEYSWRNRGYALMAYSQNTKQLYINYELLSEFRGYFPMSINDAELTIALWVESKLGIEISFIING
jgi:hypothetical protein